MLVRQRDETVMEEEDRDSDSDWVPDEDRESLPGEEAELENTWVRWWDEFDGQRKVLPIESAKTRALTVMLEGR